MAKKPDVDYASLSIDELESVVEESTAVLKEKKDTRRAELLAELERLGGAPRPSRPSKAGDGVRAAPKAQYRTPDGSFEWSGRGAIPTAFKNLGVTDKAGMEKYRIP